MRGIAVQAKRAGFVAWFVVCCLLLFVGTSAATSIGGTPLQISVAAGTGLELVHYTTAGRPIAIDVIIEAQGATPFSSDVYVVILSPDGRATSLLVNGALPFINVVPALVTGPPVPLFGNVILDKGAGGRLLIPNFGAGGPPGWYVICGLIVAAGRDPGDPKQWASSSFFPLLVTSGSQ